MRTLCLVLVPLMLASCEPSASPSCPVGQVGCACTPDGLCIEGLSCLENVCHMEIAEESGTSDVDTTSATDGMASSSSESTASGEIDSTGEPSCQAPDIECDGVCVNPLTDNLNCGECGNMCVIEWELGGCVEGYCAPRLSDCVAWDNPIPCSEVCAQSVGSCVEMGCDGFTYYSYGSLAQCLGYAYNAVSSAPCTEPDFATNGAYRCCCAQ
jgi:hypothetical protein